jgi:hypothetical protein
VLTAIICTFDRYHVLGDAIASLRAQDIPIEIIIIDNSPDQARAHATAQTYGGIPNLRYIPEPAPGLSRARNTGIALAGTDIVAFIDDDAVAAPAWARGLLAAFGPGIGAVGGPVRPIWGAPRPAWLGDDLLNFLSLIDWGPAPHEVVAGRGLIGCNLALDKQLVVELGGFPEHLGRSGSEASLLSNDEAGLLARISAAGRGIFYTPDAAVAHLVEPGRLTQEWFLKRAAWQAVSDYLMDPERFSAGVAAHRAQFQAGAPGAYEDATAFSAMFWVTYHATLSALAGAALPLAPSAGWLGQWRAARLKGRLFALTQNRPYLSGLGRLGLRSYRRLRGR